MVNGLDSIVVVVVVIIIIIIIVIIIIQLDKNTGMNMHQNQ